MCPLSLLSTRRVCTSLQQYICRIIRQWKTAELFPSNARPGCTAAVFSVSVSRSLPLYLLLPLSPSLSAYCSHFLPLTLRISSLRLTGWTMSVTLTRSTLPGASFPGRRIASLERFVASPPSKAPAEDEGGGLLLGFIAAHTPIRIYLTIRSSTRCIRQASETNPTNKRACFCVAAPQNDDLKLHPPAL